MIRSGRKLPSLKKSVRSFLNVNPETQFEIVRGLASPVRVRILRLLRRRGPLNVNQISEALGMPQSTIATNIQILEEFEFDRYGNRARPQGPAKDLRRAVRRDRDPARWRGDQPRKGHHRSRDAARALHQLPCLGAVRPVLDRGDHGRARCARPVSRSVPGAGRADMVRTRLRRIQVSQQCESAGCPGRWRSNSRWNYPRRFPAPMPTGLPTSALWVNDVKVGTWTSPGDYGDRRGVHTPRWWKLEGSQYGALTQWHISSKGTFMGTKKLSSVTLAQLRLAEHHSIRLRIGIDDKAAHPGGRQYFRPWFWQPQPGYPDAPAPEVRPPVATRLPETGRS